MDTKYLHITPRDVFMAQGMLGNIKHGHFIDLPDGTVLSSSTFHDEQQLSRFESNTVVEPVAQDEPVSEKHAARLAHLGVKAGHTAKQVRTLAKKTHGLM